MAQRPLILSAPTLFSHRDPITAAEARSVADAGADAGFDGISIWTAHHDWARADGASEEEFFDWHRQRGLTMPAAEVVLEWTGPDRDAVAAACGPLLEVAARAGSSSVVAVTLAAEPPDAAARAGLTALCELAAERGLAVSFEFLPWTGVPTIAAARELIEAVDRENLGLVLDAWHWQRQPGGPDPATLAALPPERIHLLQLNDAPAAATPGELPLETSTARLLPGAGDIDLIALLDAVAATGAAPLIVSEVFSAELAALGPAESARRQYAALTAVLAEHEEVAKATSRRSL